MDEASQKHRPTATLRYRALLILSLTFLSSFLLLHFVSKYVLLARFEVLETENAEHCVNEVVKAIDARLEVIDTINRDWAWWDDAYAFVGEPNSEFLTSNLPAETFIDLHLDMVGIFDAVGFPVYVAIFDPEAGQKIAAPDDLLRFFDDHPELLLSGGKENFHKGILMLPQGPMLLTARPILTSEQKGPSRGTLVFGRYLDAKEFATIASPFQVFITATSLANVDNDGARLVEEIAASDGNLLVRTTSREMLTALKLLPDLFGAPALLLEVSQKRSVYEQGLYTIKVLRWCLLIISALVCLVVFILLERQIIGPVTGLARCVANIGTSGDAAQRVPMVGTAEIRTLAKNINDMLANLSLYHVELESRRKLLSLQNEEIMQTNDELAQEIKERKAMEEEREKLIAELQEALVQVKQLSGFLPICASCKKIRDDKGYWSQIEEYIRSHSEATFSHSICPDCAKKLYGDLLDPEDLENLH